MMLKRKYLPLLVLRKKEYKVKEDGSIAFLQEGQEVEGELASFYVLKKK